jgi:serine/threonine protein kinase
MVQLLNALKLHLKHLKREPRIVKSNVVIRDQRVYKYFSTTTTRKPDLAKVYLHGEITQYNQIGQVLSYPYIAGTHIPLNSGQFLGIVHVLKNMHSNNICHGDIRFANLVFSGVKSHIIDFDLSTQVGKSAKYPMGYNGNIPDGYRHPDAKPKALMQVLHDVEALRWVMAQLKPNDPDKHLIWETIMEFKDLKDLKKLLKINSTILLQLNNPIVKEFF